MKKPPTPDHPETPADEIDDELSRLGHEELAALAQRAFDAITNNPDLFPDFPPDLLAALGQKAGELTRANRECDIANLKAAMAKAKLDRTRALYDAVLADVENPKNTGH